MNVISDTVSSLNVSTEKGVAKHSVPQVIVTDSGFQGDAHAGDWHRQVSLLPLEKIRAFEQELGRTLSYGAFGENMTVEGLDFSRIAVRDTLHIGDVCLEVTQLGKTCHGDGCQIYQSAGRCIMPKYGLFCRVVTPGEIHVGDVITHHARPLKMQVLTLSDRVSKGIYSDRSGPAIAAMLQTHFEKTPWHLLMNTDVIPDDADSLRNRVKQYSNEQVDVLFTTGGTGIGPRDMTPETLLPLFEKEIFGIMDFVRMKYGATLPQALMSRSVAGVIGGMQVFALPGSVKAVKEYMTEILTVLEHNLLMLWGIDSH